MINNKPKLLYLPVTNNHINVFKIKPTKELNNFIKQLFYKFFTETQKF